MAAKKTTEDARLDAWLKGWNDGATAKTARSPRYHADEYERGYTSGQDALVDAYGSAKLRIGATERQGPVAGRT